MIITADYCRELLAPTPGLKRKSSKELINKGFSTSLRRLSQKERFELAMQLLPELETYFNARIYKNDVKIVGDLFDSLAGSLRKFDGISASEYNYLIDNLSSYLLITVLDNKFLPIDMFIDSRRSWHRVNSIAFPIGAVNIEATYDKRQREINLYARSLVPFSEHMSDEMVLKIVGFGK